MTLLSDIKHYADDYWIKLKAFYTHFTEDPRLRPMRVGFVLKCTIAMIALLFIPGFTLKFFIAVGSMLAIDWYIVDKRSAQVLEFDEMDQNLRDREEGTAE